MGRGRAARGVPPSFFVHSLLALEGEPLGRADGASPSVPIHSILVAVLGALRRRPRGAGCVAPPPLSLSSLDFFFFTLRWAGLAASALMGAAAADQAPVVRGAR